MLAPERLVWILVLAGTVAACGGDPEADEAAATPTSTTALQEEDQAEDTITAEDVGLVRETFAYRGAGRNPFISLLQGGAVRPVPRDLRVTGITYDDRYPQRSVATVQDTTENTRYALRVGDEIGRMRVTEIRPSEIVFILEDFGVERQVVLALRRRQEGRP